MITRIQSLAYAIVAFGFASTILAADAPVKAIEEITLKYEQESFLNLKKVSTVAKPLLIEDAATAAKHFSKKDSVALATLIDFKTQKLVVFAWSGSGRDTLNVMVLESYPEQIRFSLKRGRTRDLRRHLKLYALRKNVRYAVTK